jgi:hypothetical protein
MSKIFCLAPVHGYNGRRGTLFDEFIFFLLVEMNDGGFFDFTQATIFPVFGHCRKPYGLGRAESRPVDDRKCARRIAGPYAGEAVQGAIGQSRT